MSAVSQRAKDKRRAYGREYSRNFCRQYPDLRRERQLKSKYGITSAQYDRMLALQNGKCAVCGRMPKPGIRLDVEHDHTATKRVRGLCCRFCNWRRLGRVRDEDAPIYRRIAEYLASDFDGRKL